VDSEACRADSQPGRWHGGWAGRQLLRPQVGEGGTGSEASGGWHGSALRSMHGAHVVRRCVLTDRCSRACCQQLPPPGPPPHRAACCRKTQGLDVKPAAGPVAEETGALARPADRSAAPSRALLLAWMGDALREGAGHLAYRYYNWRQSTASDLQLIVTGFM